MYVDKVLLTIILCATSAWCSDRTLTRNTRTIDSSFFAWPQTLYRNLPDLSTFPNLWPSRPQLQEWTKSGVASLLRLISSASIEEMHIKFRPEDGPNAAKAYQRRFGYRGERLIERLGNGFGPDVQLHKSPVPSVFLIPPLSPVRGDNNFL